MTNNTMLTTLSCCHHVARVLLSNTTTTMLRETINEYWNKKEKDKHTVYSKLHLKFVFKKGKKHRGLSINQSIKRICKAPKSKVCSKALRHRRNKNSNSGDILHQQILCQARWSLLSIGIKKRQTYSNSNGMLLHHTFLCCYIIILYPNDFHLT